MACDLWSYTELGLVQALDECEQTGSVILAVIPEEQTEEGNNGLVSKKYYKRKPVRKIYSLQCTIYNIHLSKINILGYVLKLFYAVTTYL